MVSASCFVFSGRGGQWPPNFRLYRGTAVCFAAFLLCRPRPSARKTAVSFQPIRPFFSQSTFVGRCDSNDQLPSHWRSGCRRAGRFFALLSAAVSPRNSRQFSTKTAVFLSYQPRCQRRQPLTTFPSVRSPAFLLCRPRPSARETTVSLQPRRPFFFLSRKKEKVGGKKKESFAYGKRRNAVPSLRYGKAAFHFAYHVKSVNPIAAVRHCTA